MIRRTLVASALCAVIFVPTASAITIYKDNKNTVAIGGWVDARIINTQGTTQVVNGASRINFAFERDMDNGWRAFSKFEWSVNPFGDSELVYNSETNFEAKNSEFINNRLGYVGIGHQKYGTLTLGKQWGIWYNDVVSNTNYTMTWDGNASGTYTYNKGDGSVNGVGRGDKTVQYRNEFGDFTISVQAQLKQNTFYVCSDDTQDISCADLWDPKNTAANPVFEVEYNNTYGIAATYAVNDMLSLAAGYNTGEFEITKKNSTVSSNETDAIYGLSATWSAWGQKGLYAAVNYNKSKNHDTDNIGRMMKDSYGVETLFAYLFDNGLRPIFTYNILDAGSDYVAGTGSDTSKGDSFKRQFVVLGLHYVWTNNTVLYVEARKDFSKIEGFRADDMAKLEDDTVAIGIRYML